MYGAEGIQFHNLDRLSAYNDLRILAAERYPQFDYRAVARADMRITDDLRYNYAARMLAPKERTALCQLAADAQCIDKYRLLLNGYPINSSEGRMALHHLLRGALNTIPIIGEEGKDYQQFYDQQYQAIANFASSIRNGEIVSPQGMPYRHVVQIGIGGSSLGPHALYCALREWARSTNIQPLLEAEFIANVDPDDAHSVLSSIDVSRTLFILVSKSGNTVETMINHMLVDEWLTRHGVTNSKGQTVVVTADGSPLAHDKNYISHFFIDDHIGGRYSSCGAVGLLLLMICFGVSVARDILDGAHAADAIALQSDPLHNPPLWDALCGVYEHTFCRYPAYALLPYSHVLSRFPAHIQQLDMESSGKSVNRFGDPITYPTGPIIFGEPGTNGQHSFYQLLHQSTQIIPMLFIAFQTSSAGEKNMAHQLLNANVIAQIVAFARGQVNKNDRNRSFAGRRPSALLYGQQLTPRALGALLSFFENRVMFQGFIWNINSFDQEGVQLGKQLAHAVRDNTDDADLASYARILHGANL